MLTGVRLEIEGEQLRLAATDRYRLAVRELLWKPEQSGLAAQVLIPARTLAESAKTLTTGSEITLALSGGGAGEGMIGFAGPGRRSTTRLLDAEFPKYRSLFPSEWSATADIPVPALLEAVKRVALVADRGTPVRLDFAEGSLGLTAGGDDEGRAEEQVEAEFSGEPLTIAFNPAFLLDGLAAVHAGIARMSFTTPSKPSVITAVRRRRQHRLPLPDHAGPPARVMSGRLGTGDTRAGETSASGGHGGDRSHRARQDGRQHGRAAAPRRSHGRRLRPQRGLARGTWPASRSWSRSSASRGWSG